LVALDARLPAVLKGDDRPAGPSEQVEYARLCYYKGLYAAAARFWKEAFAADPTLLGKAGHGYDDACKAALCGSGQGEDNPKPDEAERARWRKQAFEWLRCALV